MFQQQQTIIFNSRMLAMLCLGFASGLPVALTGSTLQAWYTEAGINVIAIGALSLIGMPYLWKFLWAPFLDRFTIPLGGRRQGWILGTQLGLCIMLWIFSTFDPANQPKIMGVVGLFIAFLSASQDIASDAYRTEILSPVERGVGTAYFIFAYRIAMLISGGLALIMADYYGWRMTYQCMSIIMALLFIATYFAPRLQEISLPKTLYATITESFYDLFSRDSVGLLLLFIVFYKLGDALAASLMSNFLLHGLGFSLTQVGFAYKSVSLFGTIIGAFFGGVLLMNLGLYRALWLFGIAQALSTLMFVLLAAIGKNYSFMVLAILSENFCSGMGTAAFVAFLMTLCHKRYTATQYASLSAIAAVGRVCLGPVAGMMVTHIGWIGFYSWSFILSFPGLYLLSLLRNRVSFNVVSEF